MNTGDQTIVNQIMGMLKEVSFGHHYFEMGLLFRDSMLINGMLCSVETLYGLTNSHIEQLEQCDKMLMRRLFNSVSSTAVEAFYIETGMILPLRFTIIARRLMYLWTILQKSDSELVKQVYEAQKLSPVKNDWSTQVEQDLKYCKIDFTEEEIKVMKKSKFKKIVQDSIKSIGTEYLLSLKAKHSNQID